MRVVNFSIIDESGDRTSVTDKTGDCIEDVLRTVVRGLIGATYSEELVKKYINYNSDDGLIYRIPNAQEFDDMRQVNLKQDAYIKMLEAKLSDDVDDIEDRCDCEECSCGCDSGENETEDNRARVPANSIYIDVKTISDAKDLENLMSNIRNEFLDIIKCSKDGELDKLTEESRWQYANRHKDCDNPC